jgi:hypothetical protein
MPASSQDLLQAFDPTGYATISGAQLLQFITGAAPFTDKGLVVYTVDAGIIPDTPNAAVTTKWQRYLWIRKTATTVIPYVWGLNANTDPALLNWVAISSLTIGDKSIVNRMIDDHTIEDVKIISLDHSKLLNVPPYLSGGDTAGGDLTGTYPNPSVTNGAITGAKIAPTTIEHGNIKAQAVQPATDILPGTAFQGIRTNAGATGCEWASGVVLQIDQAEVVNVASTAGAHIASITSVPATDTTGITDTTLALAFTPKSAASTLYIDVSVPVYASGAGYIFVGLFTANAGSGSVPAIAGTCRGVPAAASAPITFSHKVVSGSTTARTYYVLFAIDGNTAKTNTADGTNRQFGLTKATIRITEYL